jgi:predicted nucleic acid-binding protein
MGRRLRAFLDTYALVETLEGNGAFRPYLRDGVTNAFNLLEFHVRACRLQGEESADAAVGRLRSKVVEIETEDVLDASRFKRGAPKGVSYADALGYAMARRRGMPFATGDKAFKGLPGVVP